MRPSIIQLRQFYSSRLGRQVKKRLRHLVLTHWPQHEGETIIGVGYAPPLLRALERSQNRPSTIAALMPADQGAIYWPIHTDNRSILGDELMPPFADNTLHRVLMLHALEFAARPDELLRVYWQMLAPGGRLLLIVPNRWGLWSRLGRTPFMRGCAFSIGAIKDLLEEAQFTLRDCSTAMFATPSSRPSDMRMSPLLEWLGGMVLPGLGGLIVIEAEKQIYANIAMPVTNAARQWSTAGAMPITERVLPSRRI